MDEEKRAYFEQIKKVLQSVALNAPHLYKDVDLLALSADWYNFFKINDLPANSVYQSYMEVLRFRATSDNMYSGVSQLDLLAAYKRLQKDISVSRITLCEVCNSTGYYLNFNFLTGKDDVLPCKH